MAGLDDRLTLTHWAPRPLPKRLGGRWCRKVAYQQETRERAAELKRARYAANREREAAKARARYQADPEKCRARKRVENLTAAQQRKLRAAYRERYQRNRAARIADAMARDRGERFLRTVLDLLYPRVVVRCSVPADCPRAVLSVPAPGQLRAVPSTIAMQREPRRAAPKSARRFDSGRPDSGSTPGPCYHHQRPSAPPLR